MKCLTDTSNGFTNENNMTKNRTLLAQTIITAIVSAALSACGPSQISAPTAAPAEIIVDPTLQRTPTLLHTATEKPSELVPKPEPQVILLRGVEGCEQDLKITANQPIQLHYGVWGSLGKAYAEAAWDSLDISLTIDGEEIEGEKHPPVENLSNHCGSNAEGIFWIYDLANLEGLPPGIHHIEVSYYANGIIEDGTGQSFGPGIMFTNSFTLDSTELADPAQSDAAMLSAPSVERLPNNPIILPEMLPGEDGVNINGPSLVRVPSWVDGALGKYYLYFAHHIGDHIRMAYADDLAGPWTIYTPGVLRLEDTICDDITGSIYLQYKHVASPDVHVDSETKQIKMYFHCPVYVSGPRDSNDSHMQVTLLATSSDGLHFEAAAEHLGNAYFRVFEWDEQYYALSMPGVFYRSKDGLTNFEEGPTLFSEDMRHSAVLVKDGKLLVFYTMVGDNPERILLSKIELLPDWMAWSASEPVTVLEPEFEWEGVKLPLEPSYRGTIMGPVRQLRDPAIFEDQGRVYLLYSVAGESGIAIAELQWQ